MGAGGARCETHPIERIWGTIVEDIHTHFAIVNITALLTARHGTLGSAYIAVVRWKCGDTHRMPCGAAGDDLGLCLGEQRPARISSESGRVWSEMLPLVKRHVCVFPASSTGTRDREGVLRAASGPHYGLECGRIGARLTHDVTNRRSSSSLAILIQCSVSVPVALLSMPSDSVHVIFIQPSSSARGDTLSPLYNVPMAGADPEALERTLSASLSTTCSTGVPLLVPPLRFLAVDAMPVDGQQCAAPSEHSGCTASGTWDARLYTVTARKDQSPVLE